MKNLCMTDRMLSNLAAVPLLPSERESGSEPAEAEAEAETEAETEATEHCQREERERQERGERSTYSVQQVQEYVSKLLLAEAHMQVCTHIPSLSKNPL